MRGALLVLLLLFPIASLPAQQTASPDTPEEAVPEHSVPQDLPCADQPKSLDELTANFSRGRVPLAAELKGTWVQIGYFNNSSRHNRSLNCAGVRRGTKFEFAITGVSYDYVIELHAIGYDVERLRMEPNRKGSVEFSVGLDADGAEELYTCRLTPRRTLACVDGQRGMELRRMKVPESQLFGVFKPSGLFQP